jgi:hypothetical protein
MRGKGHRLHHELYQVDRCLYSIVVVKQPQVTYGFSFQIMSYILNMLICVCMILLYNLLQCLLFIVMIDLSITCCSTASLIYNALLMFMIYSWIKNRTKSANIFNQAFSTEALFWDGRCLWIILAFISTTDNECLGINPWVMADIYN